MFRKDFEEVYKLDYGQMEKIVKNYKESSLISKISSTFSNILLGKFEIDSSNLENFLPSYPQYKIAKDILEGDFDYSLVDY